MSFPVSNYPHPYGTQSRDSLLEPLTQSQRTPPPTTPQAMPASMLGGAGPRSRIAKNGMFILTASYVFDWIVLVVLGVTGYIMAEVTPNKRPFWLGDPNIS